MRTPLRRGLDDEIYDVEARLSRRREELPRLAHDAGRRALDRIASPAGLAVAVAIGFVAGGGIGSRKKKRKKKDEEAPRFALGGLLMTAAVALAKAQFGSPAQMAQLLLSKLPAKKGEPRPAAGGSRPQATVEP